MIPVTKPFLPSLTAFQSYVNGIWSKQWLTNNGPLVNEFENELKKQLDLSNFLFVTNGTIALQLAIKALELTGEIITTPFSFVATTSSIVWQGCEPVFVDIDKDTLNIDVTKIEAAITPDTSAILATHVFGNPCDIDAIETLAKKYSLKVIYDAAHCFGVKYKGKSIFTYGDISITSFHATKLFHTIEGGGIFTKSEYILKKISIMRNFGYSGTDTFSEIGTNAKNSEFHAAMGLCNLPHVDEILNNRKQLYNFYKINLQNAGLQFQSIEPYADFNHAYFPVIFKSEEAMLYCKEALENVQVFCRRYFYPSLSELPYTQKMEMPVCESIAKRIMCLPMYHTLNHLERNHIVKIITQTQQRFNKNTIELKPFLETEEAVVRVV